MVSSHRYGPAEKVDDSTTPGAGLSRGAPLIHSRSDLNHEMDFLGDDKTSVCSHIISKYPVGRDVTYSILIFPTTPLPGSLLPR